MKVEVSCADSCDLCFKFSSTLKDLLRLTVVQCSGFTNEGCIWVVDQFQFDVISFY